jgi:hypothetical protein
VVDPAAAGPEIAPGDTGDDLDPADVEPAVVVAPDAAEGVDMSDAAGSELVGLVPDVEGAR